MFINHVQEEFFYKNIRALERHHPEIYTLIKENRLESIGEFQEVQKGIFNFCHEDGREFFYETNGPEQETEYILKRIDSGRFPVAISIGFGLGWIQKKLAEEFEDLPQIIIEPSIEFFHLALYAADLSRLFKNKQTTFLIGEFDIRKLEEVIYAYSHIKEIELVIHETSLKLKPQIYFQILEETEELINYYAVNFNTRQAFADLTFKNRFENLLLAPWLSHSAHFRGKFENVPALLVAGGPSLSSSMRFIQEVAQQDRTIIFAVDAATPLLIKEGVDPHFISSIDPQPIVIEKYSSLVRHPIKSNLLTMAKSCPYVLRRIEFRRRILIVENNLPDFWIWQSQGIENEDCFLTGTFSTVAHLNLGMAMFMGCNPIFLVGQDFCYKAGASDHAEGITLASKATGKDTDIEETSVLNEKVFTNASWLAAKRSMEQIIKQNDEIKVYNLSKGLHIEGTEWVTEKNVPNEIYKETTQNISAEIEFELKKEIHVLNSKKLQKKIDSIIDDCKKAKKEIKKLAQIKKLFNKKRNIDTKLDKALKKILQFKELWGVISEITVKEQIHSDIGIIDRTLKQDQIQGNAYKALFNFFEQSDKVLKRSKHKFQRLNIQLKEIENNNPDPFDFFKSGIFAPVKELNPSPENDLVILAACGQLPAIEKFKKECRKNRVLKKLVPAITKPWFEMLKAYSHSKKITCMNINRLAAIHPVGSVFIEKNLSSIWSGLAPFILLPRHIESVICWEPFSDVLPASYHQAQIAYALIKDEKPRHYFDNFIETVKAGQSADYKDYELCVRILMKFGEFDDALKILEKAVALNNGNAVLWEEIGDMLMVTKDYEGAIICYEKCLLSLPDRFQTYKKISEAYKEMGLMEPALLAMKTALNKIT